jgi:hypothetical protein
MVTSDFAHPIQIKEESDEGKIKRASRVSPAGCIRLEKTNVRDQLKMCSHITLYMPPL